MKYGNSKMLRDVTVIFPVMAAMRIGLQLSRQITGKIFIQTGQNPALDLGVAMFHGTNWATAELF